MLEKDTLQRFIFEERSVRGELAHLNASYLAILERQPYPLAIRKLLGETLTAAALLSAILKFSGSLILQVHGKGDVQLLLAQADHQGQVRGLAQWQGEVNEEASFADMMRDGRLMITIDSGKGQERYQGIVELKGESLAHALENYFTASEQLPTFIFLTADEKAAAGLLLQVLPGQYDSDPGVAWEHLTHLSRTLTSQEMLQLSNQEILTRLFHEEDIRLYDATPVRFYCHCNRDRMEQAILTMGREEALDFVNKKKVITVTCEFCNKHQDFDVVDVAKIFADKNF